MRLEIANVRRIETRPRGHKIRIIRIRAVLYAVASLSRTTCALCDLRAAASTVLSNIIIL
jgi:hypothetical protein